MSFTFDELLTSVTSPVACYIALRLHFAKSDEERARLESMDVHQAHVEMYRHQLSHATAHSDALATARWMEKRGARQIFHTAIESTNPDFAANAFSDPDTVC